jgi:hypothetical protein
VALLPAPSAVHEQGSAPGQHSRRSVAPITGAVVGGADAAMRAVTFRDLQQQHCKTCSGSTLSNMRNAGGGWRELR